jgi:hypothetical protein
MTKTDDPRSEPDGAVPDEQIEGVAGGAEAQRSRVTSLTVTFGGQTTTPLSQEADALDLDTKSGG